MKKVEFTEEESKFFGNLLNEKDVELLGYDGTDLVYKVPNKLMFLKQTKRKDIAHIALLAKKWFSEKHGLVITSGFKNKRGFATTENKEKKILVSVNEHTEETAIFKCCDVCSQHLGIK